MQDFVDWQGRKGIRIGLAADHGGLGKKAKLLEFLRAQGLNADDLGPYELDPEDDYPDYACKLADAVARGRLDCGVLICRSGVGMSIAANRYKGVRAALAESPKKALLSRSHNASNVLVTGGDDMSDEQLIAVIKTWLDTPFSGESRHARRLRSIERLSHDETAVIRAVDPEIAEIIEAETRRQDEGLELIASENFTSPAVRAAAGSTLTNKYAEGYPAKRYYNGCECVDRAESLAISRACELFGAEAANVQSHSGSQANMAAYMALIEPGDKVLAMSLDHGGHLTHGLKVNFSGMFYQFSGYGVSRETEMLDYDHIAALAAEQKPRLLVVGASAYPRSFDFARLRQIADSVGAKLMVDMAHIAGLVAAGEHPSPVPYADVVTSTTHKTLRGPRSGLVLCREEYLKKINSAVFPGLQGGPLMHVIAAKAVCFKEAMSPEFKKYQHQVRLNANTLAAALQKAGFRLVSGGTDNHLMLVDMRPKHTTGKAAAEAMARADITVNKNLIPFDPEKPTVTSGVRIGVPAVTTRGMGEEQMRQIAALIARVVENQENAAVIAAVRDEVHAMTRAFPLPAVRL